MWPVSGSTRTSTGADQLARAGVDHLGGQQLTSEVHHRPGAALHGRQRQQRDQLVRRGQRAVHADQRGLARLRLRGHDGERPGRGGDHVADPAASRGSTGPNQPSAIASSLETTQARWPSTSRQAASTSTAAPGTVYTCLARGSPPSSATPSRSPGTVSASTRSSARHVHHAVIGRHVQRGVPRQRARQLLGQLVDVPELVPPGIRGHPHSCPVASSSPWYTIVQRPVRPPSAAAARRPARRACSRGT